MPEYKVTHRTTYDYAAPVVQSRHLLYLAPRETPYQHVQRHNLLVEPAPTMKYERQDYFGNRTEQIVLEREHVELSVTSVSEVVVSDAATADFEASVPWETVADRKIGVAEGFDRSVADFCVPSSLVAPSAAARAFALETISPGAPALTAAQKVMTRIFEEFRFDSEATDVATPVDQVLEQRAGVCQDFAHTAIDILRSLGLPARYVSGYIRTIPPEGEERLVGADASHAWFSAWAPEFGWVDFDPTNNLINSTDHVTAAYGRDFADVSPISGVLLGGGDHSVSVSVDVAPLKS